MTFSKWLQSDSTGANSFPTDVTSSSERFNLLMFCRTTSRLWHLVRMHLVWGIKLRDCNALRDGLWHVLGQSQ